MKTFFARVGRWLAGFVVLGVIVFVGWMNLTPGHFYYLEESCCKGNVVYDIEPTSQAWCRMLCPSRDSKVSFAKLLSVFDLNK